MRKRLAIAVALTLALSGVTPCAFAKPTGKPDGTRTEQARERAKRGYTFYDVGKYVEASIAFEEAYSLRPDAGLLFNAAQAARLGGDMVRAQTLYSSYVSFHPDGANLAEAKLNLEKIEAARKEPTKPPTTTNDKPPTTTNDKPPVVERPPPSEPTRRTSSDGRPLVKKWWFWTAIAGGVVVVGGAVTLGVLLTRPAPAWNNLEPFGPGVTTKTTSLSTPLSLRF